MAVSKSSVVLALVMFSICVVDAAHHQTTAAAPSPSSSSSSSVDCSSLILNMADCLSFVSGGSEVSKPEGSCCSGLKSVIKADPQCLCEAFKSSASLGVTLNITKAMTLPTVCKVSAPISNCDLSLSPAGAPGMLPPSIAGAPSEGASEIAPAPAPGSSGSALLSASMGSLVLGLTIMLISVV